MNFLFANHARFLRVLSLLLLVAGLTAAQAQRPAEMRPAGVPQGYIITPFGYFHPSCFKQLAEGDVLREDRRAIQHKNGSSEAMSVCAYPHYKANGEAIGANQKPVDNPTISHAWVEYGGTTTTTSYGELTAKWTVPPGPKAGTSQVLYFFPGLEDYKDVVTIIQPVLGWNSDYHDAWGIASWNCCTSGTVYESSPVSVKSGDAIYGTMKDTCAAGTLACATWNVTTEDITTGKSTTLGKTSAQGQTFNWAFGGVLEVYSISACTNYPTSGSIVFSSVALYNDRFVAIANPGWSITNSSAGLTPQCSYGGHETATQITLTF
jgi:hypothetical protein